MHSKFLLSVCVLALSHCLASCTSDNRVADIKKCIAQVEYKASHGELPYLLATDSAEAHHDKIGSEIVDCMAKAGYRHDETAMANEHCVDDVDFNAYCYLRS